MGGPGLQRVRVALPLLRGIGVHEIEAGGGVDAVEQRGAGRRIDDVPAHVRDHRGVQPDDGARPLPAAGGLLAELDTAGEQDLHPDAHAEHRSAGRDSVGDELVPADLSQTGHARLERADAGHHKPVGVARRVSVGGHLDVSADALQRPLRRSQVSGAVVEDDDFGCHSVPLVDGTPLTRGSYSTAWRSARATALYCASVMWCGSRPYKVRTCSAMRAFIANDSKTCRLITVW